jgi:hypothetical protein
MRLDTQPVIPSITSTPNELYSLSPQERRQKRHDASVAQAFLDGQVQCPRKGPMRPQISVVTCETMHAQAPTECQGCGCRLHLIAPGKVKELSKLRSST